MISNFFELFEENYSSNPDKIALVFNPESNAKSYTFKQIYEKVAIIQYQIRAQGVKKNSKVLMLSEPSPDFYFFSLALIALGATPVFIEAKKEDIFRRLLATSSDFLFVNNKTKKLKFIFPFLWNKQAFTFTKTSFGFTSIKTDLNSKDQVTPPKVLISSMKPSDPFLISFTTGSTGTPKAADRNYFVSYYQHCASMKYWHHEDSDVDLTFFPNILFQNLCSGVTTLIPKMLVKDLSDIPFDKFSDVIRKYNVTRISAPPGYLNQLCNKINEPLESISKVITGGAPVDKALATKVLEKFPKADSNVVYGSTEAEPIAFKDLYSIANVEKEGFLVGKPIDEIKVLISNPIAKNIETCSTGEILISGKHVVQKYINSDLDNKEFKIKDKNGIIWHRTGDIGYLNSEDEIVLLGRKSHCLASKKGEQYSLNLENKFNRSLPSGSRCALIQKDAKTILVIEHEEENEIIILANSFMSEYFNDFKIFFISKIPVDFRHHWKVNYSSLKSELPAI